MDALIDAEKKQCEYDKNNSEVNAAEEGVSKELNT
jgi:hypothetical protein